MTTPKKPVKKSFLTQEEWKKFEGVMDEILKAPPQHKKAEKKIVKRKR